MDERKPPETDIWTLDDAAAHFRCSTPTVKKMANKEALPYFMMGRLWRFRRVDVLKWEEAQRRNVSNEVA